MNYEQILEKFVHINEPVVLDLFFNIITKSFEDSLKDNVELKIKNRAIDILLSKYIEIEDFEKCATLRNLKEYLNK